MPFKKDLRLLLKPYYFINILLSLSYIISKRISIICNYVFAQAECELDGVSHLNMKIEILLNYLNRVYFSKYIFLLERNRNTIFSHDSYNDKDTKNWKCNYDKLFIIQLCIY